jgi:hypothetical protein
MKTVEKPLPLYREFISDDPRYHDHGFRHNQEDGFPWDSNGSGIWFGVLTLESEVVRYYWFTSAKSQKESLLELLKKVSDIHFLALVGVWHGEWRTDLFVLDRGIAVKKLGEVSLSDKRK